jgi:CRISPR-associated protein Csm4
MHTSSEMIHSDTLFSAMINIANKIGVVDKVIREFDEGVTISSTFYFMERKEQKVFFLPSPTVPLSGNLPFKQLKSIKYVSEGIFREGIEMKIWFGADGSVATQLVRGDNWLATRSEMEKLLEGSDWQKPEELQLYHLANIPQVKVHTVEKENSFYQTGNLVIADNREFDPDLSIGMYFLMAGAASKELRTVIHLLCDEGIGGQRSTGCGHFEQVKIQESPFANLQGDESMNLSLVSPTREQVPLLKDAYYKTIERGGRRIPYRGKNSSGEKRELRLKQITMLKEGGILPQNVRGCIADISPDFNESTVPYLRYGKAFPITIPKIFES